MFERGKEYFEDALKYFFLAYESLENITITTKAEKSQSVDEVEGKGYDIQLILTSAIESIGNVYKLLGRYDDAICFYGKAVSLFVAKIGRKRHDVARLYFILAQTLYEQKDYDESLKMFTTAKDIFSSIHGDRHPETATCYYKIGLVLRQLPNRNVDALDSLKKARDRWLKEFGSDNSNVIEVEHCISELEEVFDSKTGIDS